MLFTNRNNENERASIRSNVEHLKIRSLVRALWVEIRLREALANHLPSLRANRETRPGTPRQHLNLDRIPKGGIFLRSSSIQALTVAAISSTSSGVSFVASDSNNRSAALWILSIPVPLDQFRMQRAISASWTIGLILRFTVYSTFASWLARPGDPTPGRDGQASICLEPRLESLSHSGSPFYLILEKPERVGGLSISLCSWTSVVTYTNQYWEIVPKMPHIALTDASDRSFRPHPAE